MRKLAIIILNWNGSNDTCNCLESLQMTEDQDIYILDNGSRAEEFEILVSYLEKSKYKVNYKIVKLDDIYQGVNCYLIRSKENLGFAGGNNYVVNRIVEKYRYVLLLNNDTEVPKETINSMISSMEINKCDAITCDIRYFYDKNKLWNAGGVFKWYGDRKYFTQRFIDAKEKKGERFITADFITGCALLIDTDYIKKYGLFTDKFFHGEEDYNFCLMAKKRNAKLGVDLSARLYHKVGQSLNSNRDPQKAFNTAIIHYSNRIMDYKEIYSKNKWVLWREIYLLLVMFKRASNEMKFADAFRMIMIIKKITSDNDTVDKELFQNILKGKYNIM